MTRVATFGVVIALLLTACDARFAQTAAEPAPSNGGDSGAGGRSATGGAGGVDASAGGVPCGATLSSRLSVTRVAIDADVRTKRQGYNLVPEDEPIALALDPDSAAQVAWLDAAGRKVHVTPLDARLARAGADVVLDGIEVGGIAAQRDGFALLTRGVDPGEPLNDPAADGTIGTAALFVRVRHGIEEVRAPLTGTASITNAVQTPARDCATSTLNGRLVWNGAKYGAYFAVHGCEGDMHASFYGDKLAYVDDGGRALAGGWSWKCAINEGARLVAERGAFTPFCLADRTPFPGLNFVPEDAPAVQLAPEIATVGFVAGRFGSVVKMADGTYVVAWLSRGVESGTNPPRALKTAPDVAWLRLDANRVPLGSRTWLFETPELAEANLHVAPYGAERLLVTWDSVDHLDCGPATCFGAYAGTHARLVDVRGNFLTPDETIPAVPNTDQDLAVFDNGDVAWAFAPDAKRTYEGPLLPGDGGPLTSTARTLSVARLAYCP